MNEPTIIIGKAITIEPGKTYVIHCPQRLSQTEERELLDQLDRAGEKTGARFILLQCGMTIATEPEVLVEADGPVELSQS